MDSTNRWERQERLFGVEGQRRLANQRAVICGLGGLGAHVAQQLAYLGIRDFVMVDHDRVSETNLNRLVGAYPDDIGRPKVEVISDHVSRINNSAQVQAYTMTVNDDRFSRILQTSDLVVGCLDNDAARSTLLDTCSQCACSYFDLASGVESQGTVLGGRVFYSRGGGGCLMCTGLLDQAEIRHWNSTPDQLKFEKSFYGLSTEDLSGVGPAVVPLNGVIASIAVSELMIHVTGLGDPCRMIQIQRRTPYSLWTLKPDQLDPLPGCLYCERYNREDVI